MKKLKVFLLVAVTSLFLTSSYAGTSPDKPLTVTQEIEKLLSDSSLIIEEGFSMKVVFKVSSDRRIQIHSISSPNEEVNAFLRNRLENQKLNGKAWFPEKFYELPVKVEAI